MNSRNFRQFKLFIAVMFSTEIFSHKVAGQKKTIFKSAQHNYQNKIQHKMEYFSALNSINLIFYFHLFKFLLFEALRIYSQTETMATVSDLFWICVVSKGERPDIRLVYVAFI